MDLLAAAGTGELDRDVHVGLVPGQMDHVAGQFEDSDRLPHLEHEHLAGLGPEVPGGDHELDRLGNRHEVTGHVGVRDGHRAALLDLGAEDRHDAAGRAQDVAEPHAHEPRRGVALAGGSDDPLGHRLRGAHDGVRVDRLVGGHEDEPRDPNGRGRLGRDLGRHGVVADRLERVRLHQAYVLVGGGVEDDLRAEALHDLQHPVALLAVREDGLAPAEVLLLGHLALDLEEVVLGVVEQDQQARAHLRDLSRELGADRAARPGHHDHAVLQVGADAVELLAHRVAPEDVLHLHLAQLARELHAAPQELEDRRERADRDCPLATSGNDLRPQLAGRRRDRDHDLVRRVLLEQLGDLGRAAEHAQAEQSHPTLARVVVHEPDRLHTERRVQLELAHHHLASGAGADDQRLARLALARRLRRPLDPQAGDDPGAGEQARGQDEVEDHDRPRQVVVEWLEHGEDNDERRARERRGAQQRREIPGEEVAPPLRVEAEQREDQRLADRHEGNRLPEHLLVALGDSARVDEAQDERQCPRDRDQHGVGQELLGPVPVSRVVQPAHSAPSVGRGPALGTFIRVREGPCSGAASFASAARSTLRLRWGSYSAASPTHST